MHTVVEITKQIREETLAEAVYIASPDPLNIEFIVRWPERDGVTPYMRRFTLLEISEAREGCLVKSLVNCAVRHWRGVRDGTGTNTAGRY